MTDYVNRFDLRNALYGADAVTMRGVKMINEFPAADVVEVRHGRWLSMDEKEDVIELDNNGCPVDSCRCSECGDWLRCSDEFIVRGRYCPNCGAVMDGVNDE